MTEIPFYPDDAATRRLLADSRRSGAWQFIGDFTKSGTAMLEFKDIPQDFNHLMIRYVWSSTRAGFNDTGLRFRWNNIATNYDFTYTGWNQAGTLGGVATANTWGFISAVPAGLKTNINYVGKGEVLFPFCKGPFVRSWQAKGGWHSGPSLGHYDVYGSGISGVAPITWLQMMDDVNAAYDGYTQAQLYGAI